MDNTSQKTSIVILIIAIINLIIGFIGKFDNWDNPAYKLIILFTFLSISLLLPLILLFLYKKHETNNLNIVAKSFLSGAGIAMGFNAFNLFIIKTIFKTYPCNEFCGGDNVLLGLVSVIYLILGLILMHMVNVKEKNKKELEQLQI